MCVSRITVVVLCFAAITHAADTTGEPHRSKLLGGYSDEKPADEHVQQVANVIRPKVEEKLGAGNVQEFVVEKYRSQVVGGANYYMKIRIAPGKYIHAKVFKPLDNQAEGHQLKGLQQDKSAGDRLDHVENF